MDEFQRICDLWHIFQTLFQKIFQCLNVMIRFTFNVFYSDCITHRKSKRNVAKRMPIVSLENDGSSDTWG